MRRTPGLPDNMKVSLPTSGREGGSDTASGIEPAKNIGDENNQHQQNAARALRSRRAKAAHQNMNPSFEESEDSTGNDTEVEDLMEEYEACDSRLNKLTDRASRRALSKNEQSEFKELQQKIGNVKAKLSLDTSLMSQASLNIGGDESSHPRVNTLIRGASANAIPTRRKRKDPSRQKLASAKRPRLNNKPKSKSGQGILSEIVSGSTIRDRSQISDQPVIEPIVADKADDQIYQLTKRAIQVPGADVGRIEVDAANLTRACTYFGGEKYVSAENGRWLLNGMTSKLYDFQLIAASTMLRRERSKSAPCGGILADEMGCGKTITALALVWKNQPSQRERNKVTLVVVPSDQMATQWHNQIRQHCPKLASTRFTRKGMSNIASLSHFQVMLVTYSDIERSWSKVRQIAADEKNGRNRARPIDNERLLFHDSFHRLILDECHLVKNHRSATAKAVFGLKAKHVWCVSATPAPNHGDEYFSYLKILGVEGAHDIKQYHRKWFGKNADQSEDLENLLQKIQIRRTGKTMVMGRPIFSGVPRSSYKEVVTTLSQEERLLYDAVVEPLRKELEEKQELITTDHDRERMQPQEGAPSERGHFVSKILQLYKLTGHPYMLESILSGDYFTLEQIQELLGNFKNLSLEPQSALLEQVAQVCIKVEDDSNGLIAAPESQSIRPQESPHGTAASQSVHKEHCLNMEAQLNLVLGLRATDRNCVLCPGKVIPIEAFLTSCGHLYCKLHWKKTVTMAKLDDEDGEVKCFSCDKVVHDTQEIDQADLAKAYDDRVAAEKFANALNGSRPKARVKTKQIQRKRGDDFNGNQPKGERSSFLEQSDRTHPDVPLTQSAKTIAIKEIISKWQHEAPDDKIIIFTQWILMAKIIGRVLEDSRVPFLYYVGEMRNEKKDKSLQDFHFTKDIKVMIMGFKCANLGLDMPYANRVILVDPYWNEQGEDQAFARVLRKVQTKPTFFVRLMVDESIDMRISDVKEAKKNIISRLVKEDDPYKRHEMEVEFANIALNGAAKQDNSQNHPGDAMPKVQEDHST